MTRRSAVRPSRSLALPVSVLVLVLLCLFTQASETMAGFTAQVTNSSNRTGTARYFTCDSAYTADTANALFAYRLDDVSTTVVSPGATVYEAESAVRSGDSGVASNHTGYSGTGFVDRTTDPGTGAKTTFTVSAQATDTYTIAVRYANGSGAARTLTLQVDARPVQQVTFPGMSSWDEWSTVYLSAHLAAGPHAVALSHGANDTGNVALDYLQVGQRSATVVRDTFTGTAGAALQTRSADIGGSWTKRAQSGATDDAALTAAGRVRKSGSSTYAALYTSSAVPTGADYAVSADIETVTAFAEDRIGVVGRMDPADTAGTFYLARYEQASATYALFRVVANTYTSLGGWPAPVTGPSTHRLSLDMKGTTIRMLVDGTERLSVIDGGITGAGRAGIALGFAYTTAQLRTTVTDTTGMHLDNFETTYSTVTTKPTAADFSPRMQDGRYQGVKASTPTPTNAGCPRDGGTAYVLDGSTSFVSNPTRWTGTDVFTVEVWFRTTVPGGRLIGLGDQETGISYVFDRMIYMTNDGRLVFGVHPQSLYRSISSAPGVTYADGAWHHVAATLSPAGMVLYVDGAVAATDPATTTAQAATGYWRIGYDSVFGWPTPPSNFYFTGSIRFAAVYTVALSAQQIRDHSASGR